MSDPEEMQLGGLTLEQLAGIAAALAEGHPLDRVLAQEQIDEATYRAADAAWRRHFVTSPEDVERFAEALAIAEDCLFRGVPPLDREPRAWAGFVALLATNPDAPKRWGIGPNDVARLTRLWHHRTTTDEGVHRAFQSFGSRPAPPTGVRPEPAVLRPFPWTPTEPGGTRPARAAFEPWQKLAFGVTGELPIERDPDLYAALQASIEVFPEDHARALALCALDPARYAKLAEHWQRRVRTDAAARAELQVRLADHRALCQKLKSGST